MRETSEYFEIYTLCEYIQWISSKVVKCKADKKPHECRQSLCPEYQKILMHRIKENSKQLAHDSMILETIIKRRNKLV